MASLAQTEVTQAMLVRQLEGQNVPDDEAELITWKNAARLFRHDLR